jgi:hypothetical protein
VLELRVEPAVFVERRRHPRVPLSAQVRLQLENDTNIFVLHGAIADISLGGMGLPLVHPMEVGVKVTLDISFPVIGAAGIKNVTVRGKTIYSEYIEGVHYQGIEFDQELNPKGQPDLYSRIQHILESF